MWSGGEVDAMRVWSGGGVDAMSVWSGGEVDGEPGRWMRRVRSLGFGSWIYKFSLKFIQSFTDLLRHSYSHSVIYQLIFSFTYFLC